MLCSRATVDSLLLLVIWMHTEMRRSILESDYHNHYIIWFHILEYITLHRVSGILYSYVTAAVLERKSCSQVMYF